MREYGTGGWDWGTGGGWDGALMRGAPGGGMGVTAVLAPLSPARWPLSPALCRVSPSGDPARRILAPALPFPRLNLPLRAMLCQVEKSQNKAARSTKTPPPYGTRWREQIELGDKE